MMTGRIKCVVAYEDNGKRVYAECIYAEDGLLYTVVDFLSSVREYSCELCHIDSLFHDEPCKHVVALKNFFDQFEKNINVLRMHQGMTKFSVEFESPLLEFTAEPR